LGSRSSRVSEVPGFKRVPEVLMFQRFQGSGGPWVQRFQGSKIPKALEVHWFQKFLCSRSSRVQEFLMLLRFQGSGGSWVPRF